MGLTFFSQRALAWAKHVLGWGPALGTIGAFGCYDSVCAMIAYAAGFRTMNPATFDELATAKRIFVKDSTGTYDFLPDNALDLAFPGRFKTTSSNGFNRAAIVAAIPTPDTYAYLHISTKAVPTHYVWALGTDAIADPWYGKEGSLAGYGGPAAIVKTYTVKLLPDPAIAAAALAKAHAAAVAAATAAKAVADATATASAKAAADAAQVAADVAAAAVAAQAAAEAQAAADAQAAAKPISQPTAPEFDPAAINVLRQIVEFIRQLIKLIRPGGK